MKAATFVVSIAILWTVLHAATLPADTPPPQQTADPQLAIALNSPQAFLFREQVTSKAEDPSFDLVITSARSLQGTQETIYVRPGTMRIFRGDAGLDDFTKQGGWYWRCGDSTGKSQFKEPGALIMVVRDQDGTVRWYSLAIDFRC